MNSSVPWWVIAVLVISVVLGFAGDSEAQTQAEADEAAAEYRAVVMGWSADAADKYARGCWTLKDQRFCVAPALWEEIYCEQNEVDTCRNR